MSAVVDCGVVEHDVCQTHLLRQVAGYIRVSVSVLVLISTISDQTSHLAFKLGDARAVGVT